MRRPSSPVPTAALGPLLALLGGCAEAQEPPAPPPIVLVSLDTFRADRLGSLGNPDGLTPTLDRLAGESVIFEHAYSQATITAPSHASLFTSRYPAEQDAGASKPNLTSGFSTLAEVLGAYGWGSAAFVAGGALAAEMGVGRGFDTWESAVDFGSLWHTAPMALAWLDAHGDDAPWLLFVHGYDAHVPYLKPTPYGYARADAAAVGIGQEAVRSDTERILDGRLYPDMRGLSAVQDEEVRPRGAAARARLAAIAETEGSPPPVVSDADVALVRGVYDGAVAYGDVQLGLFLAGLQARGVLDRAMLVVFSDHGEQLGEDGVFNHCCGVADEESHVVLMVRMPGGVGGGRRVEGLVELVDVMPTVLEVVGAVAPAGIHGRSFAAALRGEPFEGRGVAYTAGGLGVRMLGARTADGRLTYSGMRISSSLAPDLVESAALPGPSFQATPGLAPDAQAALRADMVAWLRTLAPATSADGAPITDGLKSKLKEHGYWDVEP